LTEEERIRQLVRRVVERTVGRRSVSDRSPAGRLLTADEVHEIPSGSELVVPEGCLVTPLARQAALERRVRLVGERGASPADEQTADGSGGDRTVAVGADHGGYQLKNSVIGHLEAGGYGVIDCGTDGPDAVDYPDIALAVAQLVADGGAWRGIVVDGAGIGSCMAANKVPGVRAALCYDEATAVNSREHNHANVLTLGAGMIGEALAKRIVSVWLETPAGGGRHRRRVDKITDIEQRYARRRKNGGE
jgi:ribose 5-phosphate isomerase B